MPRRPRSPDRSARSWASAKSRWASSGPIPMRAPNWSSRMRARTPRARVSGVSSMPSRRSTAAWNRRNESTRSLRRPKLAARTPHRAASRRRSARCQCQASMAAVSSSRSGSSAASASATGGVQRLAPAGQQGAVGHLLGDGLPEAVGRARGPRHLFDQLRVAQGPERLVEASPCRSETRARTGRENVRPITDAVWRSALCCADEAVDPGGHDGVHAGWDLHLVQRARELVLPRLAGEGAVLEEGAHDLLHEVRVPAGALGHEADEGRQGWVDAEHLADELDPPRPPPTAPGRSPGRRAAASTWWRSRAGSSSGRACGCRAACRPCARRSRCSEGRTTEGPRGGRRTALRRCGWR